MKDLRKAVGLNIRKYREKMGLTQEELAKKTLVSFQAVSAWERGNSMPDLENAVRLSRVFGIGLDSLLSEDRETLYVGIDGGGTKTEFCLFNSRGVVRRRVVGKASNPNDVGKDACIEILDEGIRQVLRGATPQRIFAGIAGAGAGNWSRVLEEELQHRYSAQSWVDSDLANALSLGENPSSSAIVICGTGSCVCVRKNGSVFRLGGWGQLFDESGSAYDVGKDAIRHALGVLDGLERESLVSQYVKEELHGDLWGSVGMIYEKGRPYIASLAPLVLRAHKEGDPKAKWILEKSAGRLADLIRATYRYDTGKRFIATGSFFKDEDFCAMVEKASGCELIHSAMEPIYGACVEVLRRSGEELPEGFRENFIESYGEMKNENRNEK